VTNRRVAIWEGSGSGKADKGAFSITGAVKRIPTTVMAIDDPQVRLDILTLDRDYEAFMEGLKSHLRDEVAAEEASGYHLDWHDPISDLADQLTELGLVRDGSADNMATEWLGPREFYIEAGERRTISMAVRKPAQPTVYMVRAEADGQAVLGTPVVVATPEYWAERAVPLVVV
jgi:hypothetical protein